MREQFRGLPNPLALAVHFFKGEWEEARDFVNKSPGGALPVRIVRLDMGMEEFFRSWKRFDVVLTTRALPLEAR